MVGVDDLNTINVRPLSVPEMAFSYQKMSVLYQK
jgi:hypothetical protein